jgi:large conductance mechanosensitive channel
MGCKGCRGSDLKAGASTVSQASVHVYGCASGVCAGFRDFILRGNVVDLAVAIVVGTSFTALVNALVADWLTPFIAVIFKPEEVFGALTFTINGSIFNYGHFLNVLLTFVLVCTILYFLVVLPINTLVKSVYGKKKATRECPECYGDISLKARRCKFCCQPVEPLDTGATQKLLEDDDPDEVITRSKTAPASLPTTGKSVGVDATAGPSAAAPDAAAARSKSAVLAPSTCDRV